MSSTDQAPFHATAQILNRIFWVASIGLWAWIVIRSDFWSAEFASKMFWINFLIFLAAGCGVAATTHFAASALPLMLGVAAITAHDVKAGWLWLNFYVVAAAGIGLIAGLVKLALRAAKKS